MNSLKNKKEKNNIEQNKNDLENKKVNKIDALLKEYIIEDSLGQGNFGKVKLGIHKITKEKVNKNWYNSKLFFI